MALVTVQRSPSPSQAAEDVLDAAEEDELEEEVELRSPSSRSRSFSESYLAVKGAALILPQSECQRRITRGSQCGDIKNHLQSMFYLIRPQDTIKIAVKLESVCSTTRYLVIVSCLGRQDTEECTIVGVNINEETTIGLVVPIWADMAIRLDGDGGFVVSSQDRSLVFKPVSVQAMWSALQCLHKVSEISRQHYYFPGGLTHTWLCYYQSKIRSTRDCINEWEAMDDLMVLRSDKVLNTSDTASLEIKIRTKLKEIMMKVDLEEVTTRYLRTEVEKALGMDLKEYRSFIDQETMTILGQLDKPSLILDYLYLGSEWNASNLEELQQNGVGYILNVTREIDNFFPGMFEYMNIRVWDNVQSDLLRYWEKTFKFIKQAELAGSKCLVHCKMGISRSAATVIAYLMKEFNWSAEKASDFTSDIRSCILPNEAFEAQLRTYEGILDASNQRHNELWKPDASSIVCSSPISDDFDDLNSQGTLKEIAEEILASKYGKPPPNPFTFDEVELSSRSMDSMDECFPEIPTSLSSDCDNIRLVYYRRLSDQLAEPLMAASILLDREQVAGSSSSDSSELAVAFYNCLRAHSAKAGLYHRNYSPIPRRNGDFDSNQENLFSYDREQIPWNAGTVQSTTMDYEKRIQASRTRFGSQSSANSSSDEEGRIQIKEVDVKEVPVIDIGSELMTESTTDDVRPRMPRSPRDRRKLLGRMSPFLRDDGSEKEEGALMSPPVTRRKKAKIVSTRVSESTDESFEVFHIGDEEVVVKKGKVRRHTMDFEQRKSDQDLIKPEFQEAEEESEIPPKGVVRSQKQAFESRGSSVGLPPASPVSTSPKQKEFRLFPPVEVVVEKPMKEEVALIEQDEKPARVQEGTVEFAEECELPTPGIVDFHRRSYEEREGLPADKVKKTVKKVDSDPSPCSSEPSSRRPSKLDCSEPAASHDSVTLEPHDLTKEELESGQVVQVRTLVHKFEQQSPVEDRRFDDENQYSVSAPSSPSKLTRKNVPRPHSTFGSGANLRSVQGPEQRRVRKSHGRTHPLEHLSPPAEPDQLTRGPFYKTM